MPAKPCLTCGQPFIGAGARHKACATRNPNRTAAERRRRAATVFAWQVEHGQLCPGYQRDAHLATPPTNPLTADHVVPVSDGGDEHGPLEVLCRACNTAKRDGRDRASVRRRGF